MIIRNNIWIIKTILFFMLVSMGISFMACQKKDVALKEVRELQKRVEKDPTNLDLINEYVTKGLFQQQAINGKGKDEELLKDMEEKAKQYLAQRADDKYMRLLFARIEFQLASLKNQDRKVMIAVKYVQVGLDTYTDLVENYPNDMLIRVYRFINYLNLPTIYQRGKDINEDLTVLYSFVKEADLDTVEASLKSDILGIMKEAKDLLKDNDQEAKVNEIIKKLQ